jgi:hypothetical protein
VGVACGLALGLGGGVAVDAATESADAQTSGVEVTSAQLLINQRISQAAVRRSNRALNYLAPIRSAQSDAADDGRKGVIALNDIPGAGQGWTTAQIADGAITNPELGDGAVTGPKLGADAVASEKIATGAVGSDDLADGAVSGQKIADEAVGLGQLASGLRGGIARWASVETRGGARGIIAGRGATGLSVSPSGATYTVSFDVDTDRLNCTALATSQSFSPHFIRAEVVPGGVDVSQWDLNGTGSNPPFSVALFCS